MKSPVHVVAIGARTPLGLTAESSAAAVRARISRLREHPILVDSTGEPVVGAIDGQLDPSIMGWQRIVALACSALVEVAGKLSERVQLRASIQMFLSLPEPRTGLTDEDAGLIAAEVRAALETALPGNDVRLQRVGPGHASGLHAIALSAEQLRRGAADLCLVVGVDSFCAPETVAWMLDNQLLARRGARGGFSPGEGAGCVALTSESVLRRWGLAPLGTLHGAASANEGSDSENGDEGLGVALTRAVVEATATLSPPHDVATDIYCDINGERYRTEEWGFTVLRASRGLSDASAYQAPASYWGDQGAASGPLFVTLAIQSWRRGYARGQYALLWAASRQGLRAVVVLKRPER